MLRKHLTRVHSGEDTGNFSVLILNKLAPETFLPPASGDITKGYLWK